VKPKTDDKGVRRAVFSAADVTLWHRMLDSLVTLLTIERDLEITDAASDAVNRLEFILRQRVSYARPLPDTATDEGADKETP